MSSDMKCIALIEDDPVMGESMLDRFHLEGWSVRWYRSCYEVDQCWAELVAADLILSDLRLKDGRGDNIFYRLRQEKIAKPFIVITAYASVHDAVELMRNGLTNYWTKPFDIESAVAEIQNYFEESPTQLGDAQYMLGQSAPVVQARKMLARLADKPVSVLITGESGVGKEEAVRFLVSCMAKKVNMIAVNCAAMPDNLIESELFGHEKGAFTGAHEQKTGLIEQANGGILFLDEVGDLPLDAQVKLLRVLQERALRRIAGNKDIPVDFRLICATNQDLIQMVKNGDFREDLYYRINVINVHLPSLRVRAGDVMLLANVFLEKIALRMQVPIRGFSLEAERALMAFHFPGNVRELMNRLERAVALADREILEECDLFPECSGCEDTAKQSVATLKDVIHAAERDAIMQALAQADGVVTRAAEYLGISRKNLWEKARRLSIALHDKK